MLILRGMKGRVTLWILLLVLGTVGSLLAATESTKVGGSESILSCREFKSIVSFIRQEHLRFQTMSKAESLKLSLEAIQEIPQALRLLGRSFLAAEFERVYLPRLKNRKNIAGLCLDLETSIYRAAYLKSFARILDPYSDFSLTEEVDIKSSAIDGEFIGVGIGTDPIDDYLLVTEVVQTGPSFGNLFVGDKIYKVDGHAVLGMNEMEVRQRIRGKIGTMVRFSGFRGDQSFEVEIRRSRVFQRSTEFSWLDGKILSIKIYRFFKQTSDEVEKILMTQAKDARGIILDLRSNPGGLLQAAREVVDLFVSQGIVVYLKGKAYDDQVWALNEGGELTKPLVVLVNEGTASAAEIVAGALQDYGRAVVVGQRTYGKGCVQNIYDTQLSLGIKYRGSLKLTTLWYYLPSGRSVYSLKPDLLLVSDQSHAVTAPKMPYQGPRQIDVVQMGFLSQSKQARIPAKTKWFSPSRDGEEVGRALMMEILTGDSAVSVNQNP